MELLSTLYVGFALATISNAYVGTKIAGKLGDDINFEFDNKVQIESFTTEGFGFKPKNMEFKFMAKYKICSLYEKIESDKENGLFVGYEHECFHVFDKVPTYENQKYGTNHRFFIEFKQ